MSKVKSPLYLKTPRYFDLAELIGEQPKTLADCTEEIFILHESIEHFGHALHMFAENDDNKGAQGSMRAMADSSLVVAQRIKVLGLAMKRLRLGEKSPSVAKPEPTQTVANRVVRRKRAK